MKRLARREKATVAGSQKPGLLSGLLVKTVERSASLVAD
jgi:hypothetical protein